MQPQYRVGYAQPGPGPRPAHHATPNARRAVGPGMMSAGPHPPVPLNQNQMAQQQAAHHAEMNKRRSRKPTDKSMPDGVEECIIGDGAQRYRELRDFERRLDATMTRKRLDIMDSAQRSVKRHKTLRIWITNTVDDQPWQATNSLSIDSFDFPASLESSYCVKIEGRLLDEEDDTDKDEDDGDFEEAAEVVDKMDTDAASKPKQQKPSSAKPGQKYRFSHFFKAMRVDFDRKRQIVGAEASVEWKKPEKTPAGSNLPAAADFDELTFKRNGDENQNITINLDRHEDDRFEVSPDLADIIDMREATRQQAIMGLWEYIKLMNLQEDEEKRNFRCDELLRKVVPRDPGFMPSLADYVMPHLRPLAPVKLPYTIRVDEEFHKDPQPTIYDVRVVVNEPLKARTDFLTNPQFASTLKEVAVLDDQLALLIQGVSASKAKHTFFMSMATNPAVFVQNWLSSQQRDIEVIMGEAARGGGEDLTGDEWRKGGRDSVWNSQNARESVNLMLSKPPSHR